MQIFFIFALNNKYIIKSDALMNRSVILTPHNNNNNNILKYT
jgi:hypothetical protein